MAATADNIRPFTFDVAEEQLADLRRRVAATKWPDREGDPSQGVRLETIQALADSVEATGQGSVVYASPFIPTIPGTDTYTDQLW